MGAPGTTKAGVRVTADFFAATFVFFAAAMVFVGFAFGDSDLRLRLDLGLGRARGDTELAGRRAGVRRLVLRRALAGRSRHFAGGGAQSWAPRSQSASSRVRASGWRRDSRSNREPSLRRARRSRPARACPWRTRTPDGERRERRAVAARRWSPAASWAAPSASSWQRRSAPQSPAERRRRARQAGSARKESRSHGDFLGRNGMKLNPLKGQS